MTNDKRYFYTDPLAAAWQAKHFGMRVVDCDGDEPPKDWLDSGLHGWDFEPYYIHPDSLHLLEPMVGDLAFNNAGHAKWIAKISREDMGAYWIEHGKYHSCHLNDCRIIQRNNTAFHWPESEEV